MRRRRYVAMSRPPRLDDDEDINHEMQRILTVYEPDIEPVETGLFDQYGVPLYAIDYREPIGFIHFEEEDEDGE